jgi:uracil-DNA glycosylase family 4
MGGDSNEYSAADAARMLAWWLEAGVDTSIQEEPRNWLKPRQAEALPADLPSPAPQQPLAASEMPDSLTPFLDWLSSSPALPFAAASARRVLPKGAEGAPVMLLSDAPSFEDAAAGDIIGGDVWLLTERMLAAIGIRADQAYIAALSCFHSPGSMTDDELRSCAAIARRHIALAKPQRLLLCGDAPARALLDKPMLATRGRVHTVEGVRTVVTFHPRQLLKRPSDKALAWRDLLLLMEDH